MNIMASNRRVAFLSTALAALACLGTARVMAADQIVHGYGTSQGNPSVTVSYADLNVSDMAGARTLYRRISAAAGVVCGEEGRRLEEQVPWRSCYQGAIAEAVAAVNSPLLSSVHDGQKNAPAVTAMLTR
jgi:UrcA family protein